MEELLQQVAQMRQQLADFVTHFQQHTHIGSDLTQKLPITSTFGGLVKSNVSGNTLPRGWSVAVSGGNVYTLTHNLNTTNYGIVVMPYSFTLNANPGTHGLTTFTIEFDNSSGTAFAVDWEFVLTVTV